MVNHKYTIPVHAQLDYFRSNISEVWAFNTSPLTEITKIWKNNCKDLSEKEMEICYEQCYVDIGVVKATKWRHFPFHLQPCFSALKVSLFHNWSGKLVPPYLPQCSWSLSETYESFFEVFWDEIFMVRDIVKTGQSWCLNFFRLSFRSCMSRLFNCMWWSSLHLKLVKAKFDKQTIFMILSWNVGV